VRSSHPAHTVTTERAGHTGNDSWPLQDHAGRFDRLSLPLLGVEIQVHIRTEWIGWSLGPDPEEKVFFALNSWQLALVLGGFLFGATILGLVAGRSLSHHRDSLREPFGVVQAALLTLVGLILAFGLAMAVGRYESRRAAVVDDANAIGTAYLRAQTLQGPVRSLSLPLYVQYTDESIRLARTVPGSRAQLRAIAAESVLQRRLWGLAGQALDEQPTQSAPRLYVESLNEMIDMQTTRVSGLNNRVPPAISLVQVIGAATALGLLALYLAIISRGVVTVLLAAALLTLLLFVTFDLDRPARGFIKVSAAPLVALRASMELPPAADAPRTR
jgi:hypothetical protein